MKNIKLRGNKGEMLLLVDRRTKTIFSGLEQGNVRGRNKNFYQYPRVQSPWERKRFHRNGRLMRALVVCVGVYELKVSLLF